LCAVLLTTFYVTNYKRHVRQSEEPWALFRTITAVDPSLLRNAVTSRPVALVVVPMRTAPGRMNRL
ncbi:MAG: hypothetical protein QOG28_3810, partial [Trebonia sp.]|nr:hypothetical protein [Trebonia sp.]